MLYSNIFGSIDSAIRPCFPLASNCSVGFYFSGGECLKTKIGILQIDKKFESKWSEKHSEQAPVDFEPKLNLEKFGLIDQENEIYLPVLEIERLQNHVGLTNRKPEIIQVCLK